MGLLDIWYYEVVSIDGDYANLKRTDEEIDDIKLVARALLPAEISVFLYKIFSFGFFAIKIKKMFVL